MHDTSTPHQPLSPPKHTARSYVRNSKTCLYPLKAPVHHTLSFVDVRFIAYN
jgi:hypothetical protein